MLYDGLATTAPTIGVYCSSLQSPSCFNGPCPDPATPFLTSTTQLTVAFFSRDTFFKDGFALEWSTVLSANNTPGGVGTLPDSFEDFLYARNCLSRYPSSSFQIFWLWGRVGGHLLRYGSCEQLELHWQ